MSCYHDSCPCVIARHDIRRPRSRPVFIASFVLHTYIQTASLVTFIHFFILQSVVQRPGWPLRQHHIPSFRPLAERYIMDSAQEARVRLSFEIYNTTHNPAAAATNASPRGFLEHDIRQLVDRIPAILDDGALNDTQLWEFTAGLRSLVDRSEGMGHAHRHRKY